MRFQRRPGTTLPSSTRRSTTVSVADRRACEALEPRRLLCIDHIGQSEPVIEERPDLVDARASSDANEPADIVWTNRANTTTGGSGDTDGFGARFGTSAPLARAVADAVIRSYERMIGSFNYPTAGQTYSLTVNMGGNGSGFGASAGLLSSLGGKPKSGAITMSAGNGSSDANDDNGWFLDPTPDDSSEFLGSIVNAFSGNAQTGSPAAGRGDFYTVFAAELTHCIGLFGDALPGWASLTTDTGITDTSEGGGVGRYFVFNGPSIKHLLTSNNAGGGGSDFNAAIHSAGTGGGQPLLFNGDTYIGGQDQGNAIYEFGRRYTVNNIFALMFKDAYGFSSVDPARDGTFYSVLNQTTGALTVRGAANSNDTVSVTRSGNTLTVSVDIGTDVPGTGALPGAGDLPAFVTTYDASTINSIIISGDSGNDSITIDADLALNITLAGGSGTDALRIEGDAGNQNIAYVPGGLVTIGTNTVSIQQAESLTFDGGAGVDSLTVRGTVNANTLGITGSTITAAFPVTYANFETLGVEGLGGADTINLNAPTLPTTVFADSGTDTLNVIETLAGAPVSIVNTGGALIANINVDGVGTASLLADVSQTLNTLSLGTGATVAGSGDLSISNALNFAGGSIEGTGTLNLAAAASATLSGSNLKSLGRRLNSLVALNVNGGTLAIVAGLSTTSPAVLVTGLNIAAGASIDLTDNAAIINYASASPIASIAAALTSGYAGGAWTGTGIRSSSTASAEGRALGFGEASSVFGSFPATFLGTEVDATSILIRYTVAGDANLDAAVNFDDLLILAQNYGQTGRTFAQGNFNYTGDGTVDFDDLLLLAQRYGTSLVAISVTAAPTTAAKRKATHVVVDVV